MKITMIVTGGLSGGISSAIAGGNFWDGFKQGIISAGLNHVAHMAAASIDQHAQESKLIRDLKKAKYKLDGIPDYSEEGINKMINSVDELKRLFELGGKNAKFKSQKYIFNEDGGEDYGVTHGMNVILSESANNTNLQLAYTIGHELIHVYHNAYLIPQIRAGVNNSWRAGMIVQEIEAHQWNFDMGDPNGFLMRNRYIYELRDNFKIEYKPKYLY